MVLETGIPDFWAWLFGPGGISQTFSEPGALAQWLIVMALLLGSGILITWLFSVIYRGPVAGTRLVFRRFWDATRDLFNISPRRVVSLTILCFREAIRRWAWVALVIYLILLAFAGFFLDPKTNDPAKLYMDFVFSSAAFLVTMIVLFLSVFSIPNDITRRTIYTVVTKPVRASEIILGRILGFSAVATLLLLGMGLFSYLFVNRAIDHVHALDVTKMQWEYVQDPDGLHPMLVGRTEFASEHRHDARVILKPTTESWQQSSTEVIHGHNHDIDPEFEYITVDSFTPTETGYDLTIAGNDLKVGDKCMISAADANGLPASSLDEEGFTVTGVTDNLVSIQGARGRKLLDATLASGTLMLHKVVLPLTSPQGLLTARVPIYSSDFYFTDSAGAIGRAGVNVGNVWEYRSYVEGGSRLGSVVWVFDGITAENFSIADYPNGLPLEFILSIFRTHKGDIEKGVLGSLAVVNPENNRRSTTISFVAREYTINSQLLPRIIPAVAPGGGPPENLDLFEDFVFDGDKLMIQLQCLERGQYFGVARPDLYIAAADASFAFNYIKGFFSLYLQVLVITSFGVMFSTFLSGALSLIATAIVGIVGLFSGDLQAMTGSERPPGGLLFESLYRIVTRLPMTTPLDPSWGVSFMMAADDVVAQFMKLPQRVFPDLLRLWDKDYVSNGFNIPMDILGIQIMTTLGFCIPLFVLSHFILKCREVAK